MNGFVRKLERHTENLTHLGLITDHVDRELIITQRTKLIQTALQRWCGLRLVQQTRN